MRQGLKALAVCVAMALAAGAVTPVLSPVSDIAIAAKKKSGSVKKARSKAKTRQWTGTVMELDKESLTVKKGKKKPRSKTFSRDAKMRIKGDLEEGARVTVYYRMKGRKAVAHRIVVKE